MLTVTIHKDVTEYKPKIIGGLTMRSLLCLGGGLAMAIAFGLVCTLALHIDVDSVMYLVWIAAAPLALIGFWTPHGLPFEKFAMLWLDQTMREQLVLYKSASRRAEMAAIASSERAALANAHTGHDGPLDKLRDKPGIEIWSPGGELPPMGRA